MPLPKAPIGQPLGMFAKSGSSLCGAKRASAVGASSPTGELPLIAVQLESPSGVHFRLENPGLLGLHGQERALLNFNVI